MKINFTYKAHPAPQQPVEIHSKIVERIECIGEKIRKLVTGREMVIIE
jgi:hypothetical protein